MTTWALQEAITSSEQAKAAVAIWLDWIGADPCLHITHNSPRLREQGRRTARRVIQELGRIALEGEPVHIVVTASNRQVADRLGLSVAVVHRYLTAETTRGHWLRVEEDGTAHPQGGRATRYRLHVDKAKAEWKPEQNTEREPEQKGEHYTPITPETPKVSPAYIQRSIRCGHCRNHHQTVTQVRACAGQVVTDLPVMHGMQADPDWSALPYEPASADLPASASPPLAGPAQCHRPLCGQPAEGSTTTPPFLGLCASHLSEARA
jgi:hypothetical protein